MIGVGSNLCDTRNDVSLVPNSDVTLCEVAQDSSVVVPNLKASNAHQHGCGVPCCSYPGCPALA